MSDNETVEINVSKEIEKLIETASNCSDSGDAMRFSQAANNAANAMAVLDEIRGRRADQQRRHSQKSRRST